jgi:hypothetical protein
MKLLLEGWEKYLNEANMQTAKRLSVFDFDETIAFTEMPIDVYDKATGQRVATVETQEEFDKYKSAGDYDFDFSALDRVQDPREVRSITRILRDRLANAQTQTMIITARGQGVEDDIHRYLATLRPPIDTKGIYIRGLNGGDKGQYVLEILKEFPNFKVVEFYDDSIRNVQDMRRARQASAKITNVKEFNIYHVDSGVINPVI